jgi:hypothetical protein
MTHRFNTLPLLLVAALVCVVGRPELALAQTPTGTITGRVTDTLGAGVAGVTVTVESPALQRAQTTVTSPTGDYIFKFLPPGAYTAVFRLPGFADARHTRTVSAAEPVTVDAVMQPAAVQESVTVTADAGAFVLTIETATNVKSSVMAALPTARDVMAVVGLAPSAHATGPSGAFSLAGAMSFDNLLMINGVPAQENLRGEPLDLFIEDAIQETTVTTSGISAEYGRFSGGIVNTITKSGGNLLSGSFRTTFDNDNWRAVSPFGETKTDRTVPTYEMTVGGPVVRDRLWFFGAGRAIDTTATRETGFTRIPYERSQTERRFEVKATQAPAAGHRLSVNYVGIASKTTNAAWPGSSQIMDLASLTSPENPQSLFGVHYTAALSPRLFLEAQYSRRTLGFVRNGGLNTDLVAGTPLRDQQTGAWWWAPNFCGVCPDETRNNDTLVIKASYFISNRTGAHDIVAGYDGYNDKTKADNHQSSTDYHVWATASEIRDGVVYPVIEPGFSTFIVNWPIRQSSKGTNLRTHAFFVNDRWMVGSNLTLNLGVRYDTNDGRDSSGTLVSNARALTPRLGLAWDPEGAGRTSITASFGRYVAALNNGLAGAASPAGNPAIMAYFYGGPAINTGSTLVPTDVALAQVFTWFNSRQQFPFYVDIPGVATKVGGQLESPHADEVTLGVSRLLGSRGSVRVDLVNRAFGNFYSRRTDTATGQVFDEFGQAFDLTLIENTNDLRRRYRALNLQAGYHSSALTVGAAYTLSRLWGNVDGETVESGPISSSLFAYPEYHDARWAAPEGDLAADQRHRARVWAVWTLPYGRSLANVTIGAIQSLQSGTPYGAVGTAVVSPFVANPGYALPPDVETYYYTARDAFRTAASYRTDLSINVDRGLGRQGRARLFAQIQLLNVFNRFQVFNAEHLNTVVTSAVDDSSLPLFDPFTETPVEGVHWQKSDEFGTAVSRSAYTLPRTFSFSVGVKF